VDFHIGYVGAFVLAICFVMLGAGVMHNSGTQFEPGAAGFAAQTTSPAPQDADEQPAGGEIDQRQRQLEGEDTRRRDAVEGAEEPTDGSDESGE